MAATNMNYQLVIGAALGSGFGGTIGRALNGINSLQNRAQALQQAAGDAMQAWAGLHVGRAMINSAADLEHHMAAIGITADMNEAAIASLRAEINRLSVPSETNQSVIALTDSFDALVTAGMNPIVAQGMLPSIGKAATATQADIIDLSKSVFSLNDALNIKPEGMDAALDMLAYAGKAGAFELKDMAKWLPALSAEYKNLGITGPEAVSNMAAALQIAKKGAGSTDEAANNYKNFLAKLAAPDTIERFKKAGIDLKSVLTSAMSRGENPIEVMLELLNKKTKGNFFAMGELFGDQQVLSFIKPMMANLEEYKKLKADIEGKSAGTANADFARIMETTVEKTKAAGNAVAKLSETVGRTLLPTVNVFLDTATPFLDFLTRAAETSPTLTAALVGTAGAAFVLGPAFRLTALAFQLGVSPITGAARALRNMTGAAQASNAATAAAGSGVGRLGRAARGVGRVFGSVGGIGLVFGAYELGKYLWELQDASTQAAEAQEQHKTVLQGMEGLVGGATASIMEMAAAYEKLTEGEKVYQRGKVASLLTDQEAAVKQGRHAVDTAVPGFVDKNGVVYDGSGRPINEIYDMAAGTRTAGPMTPEAEVYKLAHNLKTMDNTADIDAAVAAVGKLVEGDKQAEKLLADLTAVIYGEGNLMAQLKQRDDLRARQAALNGQPVQIPASDAAPVPPPKPGGPAALDAGGVAAMVMQAAQSLSMTVTHTHNIDLNIKAPPGVEATVGSVKSRTEPAARTGPTMRGVN